jgi:hypothetical protein
MRVDGDAVRWEEGRAREQLAEETRTNDQLGLDERAFRGVVFRKELTAKDNDCVGVEKMTACTRGGNREARRPVPRLMVCAVPALAVQPILKCRTPRMLSHFTSNSDSYFIWPRCNFIAVRISSYVAPDSIVGAR